MAVKRLMLSNFAGGLGAQMKADRERDYDEACEDHHARLIALGQAVAVATQRLHVELAQWHLFRALRIWQDRRCLQSAHDNLLRSAPTVRQPSVKEQQAWAGETGEESLDDYLDEILGNEWLLVSGYCSRGGEIDRILLGPHGIAAFEVKSNKGTVYHKSGRWQVERTGRDGKSLGWKDLSRAPDAQITKAARPLEQWLKKNGINQPVVRVVLFTRATLGSLDNPDADYIATLDGFDMRRVLGSAPCLTADQVDLIRKLILSDHAYWERQQQKRASG